MQSPGWYLRRIRSMSLAELVWRVRSLIRDQVDLPRFAAGLYPKLPARDYACASTHDPGFQCFPPEYRPAIDRHFSENPSHLSRLVEAANLILKNRLSYFNLEKIDHGDPFNWHKDHSAGIQSPVRPVLFTDYRDFETFGDCKLVWEPNRHHQFVVLARAYVATGRIEYAQKVAELMVSWIQQNPFGYGMNWKSPLELGVRIINWVWALDLIRDADVFDQDSWEQITQTLYLMIWDTQRKFSRGSSSNNHLIGEAAGVYIGCAYFPSFPGTEKWQKAAKEILEREIVLQSHEDGCTREHAFGYQVFVMQFFSVCLLAGRRASDEFSERYRDRLHRMYAFLSEIATDTGHPPNSGDADDGYVLDLGDPPGRTKAMTSLGATLFHDPTLMFEPGTETVCWLLGKELSSTESNSDRVARSVSFPESGYHILRSSSATDRPEDCLSVFVDIAQLGLPPLYAHGHADCLSFCLSANGLPLIVDSGTYDYFSHPSLRRHFRETEAHNTLVVDDLSQSEISGPFMWTSNRAEPTLVDWQDNDDESVLIGEHSGYERLADPVTHRRQFVLKKSANSMTITDVLNCSEPHSASIYFHFSPHCKVRLNDRRVTASHSGGAAIALLCNFGQIELIESNNCAGTGWVSTGYHQKEESTCMKVSGMVNPGQHIITTIERIDGDSRSG